MKAWYKGLVVDGSFVDGSFVWKKIRIGFEVFICN